MSHRYYCYVFFEFNVSFTAPNFLASSQTRGGGESVKSDGVKPDVDGELTCTHATISANTNWQTKPKLLRSDSSLVATWSLHFPRNHIKKQQSLVTNIVTLRMQHMSKWHMAAQLKNNIFLVLICFENPYFNNSKDFYNFKFIWLSLSHCDVSREFWTIRCEDIFWSFKYFDSFGFSTKIKDKLAEKTDSLFQKPLFSPSLFLIFFVELYL